MLLLFPLLMTVLPCTAAPPASDAQPAVAASPTDVTVSPDAGFHTLLLAPSQKVKFLVLLNHAFWPGNAQANWDPLFGKTDPKTEVYTAPRETPPGGLDIIRLGTPDPRAPFITIAVSISRSGSTTRATLPDGPRYDFQRPALISPVAVPIGSISYNIRYSTNRPEYSVVALPADGRVSALVECYRRGPFLPTPVAAILLQGMQRPDGKMRTPDGAEYTVVSSDWVQTTIPKMPWTLLLTAEGPLQPKDLARILLQTSDVPRGKFSGVKIYTRTFNLVKTRFHDFYRVPAPVPMLQNGYPAANGSTSSLATSRAPIYSFTTVETLNGRAEESRPFWAQVLWKQHTLKSPLWVPSYGSYRLPQDLAGGVRP